MDHIQPREGYRGRKGNPTPPLESSDGARGGVAPREGYSPVGMGRPSFPDVPTPEGATPRGTGDPYSNEMINQKVDAPVTRREGGPEASRTMSNPLK